MPLFNDTITLGVKADLTQFEKDILSATARASAQIKPITLRVNNQASQPLGKITGDISQFNKSLDAATARVLAFSANVAIINGVVQGFRNLVKETIEVEKALTDINVVLNTNQKGLNALSDSLFDIAKNTSQSFKAVTEAALEFSRQGLSIEQTLKATNAALVLSRISGLDAADSVKTLTTAMNGFNKEALNYEQIVNRLANVDSSFAVSTKDMAEALTRVGSTASEANVSFNELIATVTAVQQTTSRGGAVIGNALKTIFTRISRESTIQQLRELGVAIDESQSGIEKLRGISAAVNNADKATAAQIKELAGGVFQINVVTAALGDLSKQYSVYDNALKIANNSTDEAIRRNEALNQTLAALSQQAGTNIDQLLAKIGKISLSGNLKGLFSGFNSITKSLIEGLDGEDLGARLGQGLLKGVGNFLTGPAAIVALGAFTKLVANVGKDAFAAFRSTAGITSEADKQAKIQKTIEGFLENNQALYQKQLITGKGLVGVQQDLVNQLKAEAQIRAAIGKVTPQFASAVSPLVDVKGGKIFPKAAGGFLPAMLQEKSMVSRGVGGASSSANPVYIPRFNFGNKTGPIIVNTSEKIIENWMGGKGSAVLNPDMIAALGGEQGLSKYGKVKNVAEGFTPNMASFELAGGKVNLKRRGGDLILDEILAGFDPTGNRKEGTGIVRQAFDLAIEEGKKLGAGNLIVDILNSKVASSLNSNPKFAGFGPFGIGKFKIPLGGFAGGHIPNLAPTTFLKSAQFIGSGAFGEVYRNKRFSNLAFKDLRGNRAATEEEVQDEYIRTKFGEALGLPVAPVLGSLRRSKARGGLFKSYIGGIGGDELSGIVGYDKQNEFTKSLQSIFGAKGTRVSDLHSENYKINASRDEILSLVKEKGWDGAKGELLQKAVVIDTGQLKAINTESMSLFDAISKSSARGFVPSMSAESPLKDSITREIVSLVKQGYPLSAAKDSVRIDRDKSLIAPHNPVGFGVFNTLQGQTSLRRAFADHGGQNLKTVGKADGFVPNLAPFSGFSVGADPKTGKAEIQNTQNQAAGKQIVDEINQLLNSIKNSLDPKQRAADLSKIDVTIKKLNQKSADLVANQLDKAVDYSAKSILSSISAKGLRSPSGQQLGKEKVSEINALLQKVATSESPTEVQEIQKQFSQIGKEVNKATAAKLAKQFNTVVKFGHESRENTQASAEDIHDAAQAAVAKRGLFSVNSVDNILKSQQGFSDLPPQEQAKLREKIGQQSSISRKQSFERASLGIAFAGSLVTPFLDQGAASLRQSNSPKAAGAVDTASSALQFASFGAVLGPIPAAIGGIVGALVGLGKAADGSATKAEELTKKLDDLQAKNSETLNGFSSYIQVQQKLNGIIEEGGKASDIIQVRQELERVFASIGDETVRKNIIATGGTMKELTETFAKVQIDLFQKQKQLEGLTIAATEKAKNTNFFGLRSNTTFSSQSVSSIAQSLTAGASSDQLKDLGEALKSISSSSEGDFAGALAKVGVGLDKAKSLFSDLETPLNRLLVIDKLKENLDIAKQLDSATEATIRYKRGITDLNKTLNTLVTFQNSDRRTQLGLAANDFSVGQNGAQNSANNRFIGAGPIVQAQIAQAFQEAQVKFSSQQEKANANLDLRGGVTGFISANRQNLQGQDKPFLDKLDALAISGKGDIGRLAQEALIKATGNGENSKTFQEIANILNDAKNRLVNIDDNEKSQVNILRQNLSALKERVAIENKLNLLGGAEGQLGFGAQGLERFQNRDILGSLGRPGSSLSAFGNREQALGINEFQKTFGNIPGFKVSDIIPNAEEIFKNAIRDNLVQGASRIGVPVTGERLSQFDNIASLQAKQLVQKQELTDQEKAVLLGQEVSKSFQYDKLVTGTTTGFSTALNGSSIATSTSVLPSIEKFLASKFGGESVRNTLQSEQADKREKASNLQSRINTTEANINKLRAEKGIVTLPITGFNGFASNKALEAAKGASLSPESSFDGSVSSLNAEISRVLLNQKGLGDISTKQEVLKNANDILNVGDRNPDSYVRDAFRAQFSTETVNGRQKLTGQGESEFIDQLNKIKAIRVRDPETQKSIAEQTQGLQESVTSLQALNKEIDGLTAAIKSAEFDLKLIEASKPKVDSGAGGLDITKPATSPFALPTIKIGTIGGFVEKANAIREEALAKANAARLKQLQEEKDKQGAAASENFSFLESRSKAFGFTDSDRASITSFRSTRRDLDEAQTRGLPTGGIEDTLRGIETNLLRQAQTQQLFLGQANPELQDAIGSGSFRQNSRDIGDNNAKLNFDNIIKQANEAFVSGFASGPELTKIGINIAQGLEDYTRAQIKLGFSPTEAKAKADALREIIQGRLDKLDIKLPKSKIEEFGQGFNAQVGNLQKSFDDLGQLGANTADSLVNGFGDAFFEIASGAKSAEDAVRGLLSGIAADLSKFFLKRAIAGAVGAAIGTGVTGTGKFAAQGGLMFAQGGGVPARVMGGERMFSPEIVKSYGVDFFKDLNAGKIQAPQIGKGGRIKGGSGHKDDLYGMFDPHTFILSKAATNKYSPEFLDSIAEGGQYAKGGTVQKAFFGALLGAILSKAITGAVVGAATAKLTGGNWKKGAILGGITGGIAGGVGGFSAAQSATGSFGSQFGGSFSNGFGYLGLGDKTNGTAPDRSGIGEKTTYEDFIKNNPDSSAAKGQFATGVGNQAIDASKPSPLKNAGINLATGLLLGLASSALAPKTAGSQPTTIKGTGSITTYNPDGSVLINTSGGTKTIRRTDYSSTSQLESLISQNGGNLPKNGIPSFAQGGLASGSGSIVTKNKSSIDKISFDKVSISELMRGLSGGKSGYAQKPVGMFELGGGVDEDMFGKQTSAYINTGTGTKDDVYLKAKKGEFILNDIATKHFGMGLLNRMNSLGVTKQDITSRYQGGILAFENGGAVERNPSDRDKGLFSLGSPSTGNPTVAAPQNGPAVGSNNSFVININMNGQGGSDVSVSKTTSGKQDEKNSVDSQKFANKVKALFDTFVDTESRPGGSLAKS